MMHERKLTMLMDFYEMTMSNGYFRNGLQDRQVVFDVFYRRNPDEGGFAIFAGLQQIIDYIEELCFTEEDIEYLRSRNIFGEEFLSYLKDFTFKGTITALKEGTVMYPGTPIITVTAPLIDAQLIETMLLVEVNHQSLIATKARRMAKTAGVPISDFGARRAHGGDAAVYGARAAYIGGTESTATVLAGQLFDIPISGTMAHSWVMYFPNEYEAFKAYALEYPDACTLLVDTFDVLNSGIPNAIRVAKEVLEPMGKRLKGIRLDSGDLAYLSKKARKTLDDAGCKDCKIVVSNSIDEFTIQSLNAQNACIDVYGIGERLITAKSDPVFGAVYKIVAAQTEDGSFEPKIKVSENIEKITNPGKKKLWRIYNKEGYAIADLLTLEEETVDVSQPYRYIDPVKPWKIREFEDVTAEPLHVTVFENGKLVYQNPDVKEIKAYVEKQFETEIWEEEQRLVNPHIHYVDMSPRLYELKMNLLYKNRK